MSSQSPAVVLYNSSGVELDVLNNTSLVTGQSAILIAGLNPSSNTTFALSSLIGAQGVSEFSQTNNVQNAATVTASGSFTMLQSYVGVQEFALVVNCGTVTGSGSIQYSIQEFDPANGGVLYGNSATTVVINNGNAPGVFTAVLNTTTATMVKVTWTVTGTFSATITSNIVTKSTPSSQTTSISGTVAVTQSGAWTVTANQGSPNSLINAWPVELTDGYGHLFGEPNNPISITGSISAVNPSVSNTAAAPPTQATYVGALVNTSAPSGYTNGDMYPFSLTTGGLLRIDGDYPTGTSTGSAPDMMQVGGIVTTSAPTYTTGQINALSLDTSGNLRVNAVVNKATTSSITSVASATSNTTILSPNASRLFASIFNGATTKMYVKLGTTASTSSYSIELWPNSYWEVPVDWTGEVDGIWTGSPTGNALISELSP